MNQVKREPQQAHPTLTQQNVFVEPTTEESFRQRKTQRAWHEDGEYAKKK